MFNFQWLIVRVTALLILVGILIDIEVIIIIMGFLVLHINVGLQTIIYDYIHLEEVKFLSLFLIRISAIEIIGYMLEFLV